MSLFFSFDGIDGAGKSTQIDQFVAWLQGRKLDVVCWRDPGSTELGEVLRDLILKRSDIPLGTRSEALLYMAARAQLVEQQLRPALEAGGVVITDRFLLANVAYQGYGGGLDPDEIWKVGSFATGGLWPDCTFLLDLPVETALQRLGRSPDRLEARGASYLQRVREGFLKEARSRPSILVLDAGGSISHVQQQIRHQAERILLDRSQ